MPEHCIALLSERANPWERVAVADGKLRDEVSVTVVLPGVDTRTYRPIDRLEARRVLGLDPERHLLVAVTDDVSRFT